MCESKAGGMRALRIVVAGSEELTGQESREASKRYRVEYQSVQ